MGTDFITISVLGMAIVTIVLLGTVVLVQNPRQRLHQSFFALSLAASLWVLTNLVFVVARQDPIQYASAFLSYGAAGALVLFFLLYCMELAKAKLHKSYMAIIYAAAIVMTIGSVIPGIIGIGVTTDNRILTNPVPLMIYGLYILLYIGTGLVYLVWSRAHSRGTERSKISIVLAGLILAAVVAITFNLILPIFDNYGFVNVGPVATLFLVATSTYAIIRHRLFDIKLTVVRGGAYLLTLGTLSIIYYMAAYLTSVVLISGSKLSASISPLYVVLALVLAFAFQPIKRFFDQITDSFFYRSNYKSEVFFAALSDLLSSTSDLRGLLERASTQMARTFKAEQAFFFLAYSGETDHHIAAGTPGHVKLQIDDARVIDEYVASSGAGIFLTQLLEEDAKVRRTLNKYKIDLVMPLRHDNQIAGYLMLGEHLSGTYTKRDLNVLAAVTNELVIAIQNALSLQEVKDLNATLQQRINVATKELRASNAQLKRVDEVKDEFMSMASHQLRTPLTSIKGYLSMVLEGDAGNLTKQQHKLLLEAFNSSERMVRLIADFLNVSRLQTGKFVIDKTSFNVGDAVKQETDNLKLIAASHDVKLRLNIPTHSLPVIADEQKVRQVIMNFIDNAIYYSRPKSTIVVNAECVKNEVAFTVVDTGIGIPVEDQAKLFTKFFRAENARKQRPDGTGVGLYLARRVITAHNGSIIFSSVEGKGSTFGFRLPLDMSEKKAEAPTPEMAGVGK